MKMQIWKTSLKICIIQHYQANFIMKELLGDESAAHDEYEIDILYHLNIAVGSREEVIVDLCKNNGWKPEFEDLWQVKLHKILLFILILFHSQGQSTVYKQPQLLHVFYILLVFFF